MVQSKLKTMTTENNGWISVEDKLPDFNQRVIIEIDERFVYCGKWTASGWFHYDSVGVVEVLKTSKVTRWQPLPQSTQNSKQ